jgi:hypothetical protein
MIMFRYNIIQYSKFLLVLFLFITLSQNAYTDNVTLTDAHRVFKSIDRSIIAIKWKCRKEPNFRLSDANNFSSKLPRKENIFEEYTVLYDTKSRRFLLQGQYCIPWIDGEPPTIMKDFAFSYDGKKYVYWEKRKKEKTDFDDYPGVAFISDAVELLDCDKSFITSNAASVGFGIGFPGRITLHMPDSFSAVSLLELLEEWKSKKSPVLIQETQDGKWKIEGMIPWLIGDEMYIHIFCDPFHDGVVSEFVRLLRSKNKDYVEERMVVEFTQNSQGKLVPNIARLIFPLDKLMTEFHYKDVEFLSNVSNQAFQFKIPDGTYVTDHIAKKYYKVGNLVDEDKAISDFMTRHGLTGNVPYKPTYSNIVRIILITIGGLMILASIILYIRKKWLNS